MYIVTIRNIKTGELIKADVTGFASALLLVSQFKTNKFATVIQKRK